MFIQLFCINNMIKDQNRQAITQKDELVQQMVAKTYKQMRELGQFETVHQIFSKLPISRIQKEQYQFLFDSVHQNVTQQINRQDHLIKILEHQQELTRKIQVKAYRDKNKSKILESEKSVNSNEQAPKTVTLSNYDFSHLLENVFSQKLTSGRPIFRAIQYLRNQDRKKEIQGDSLPFLPDQEYISFKQIRYEIGDIKMLLENQRPLKRFQLQVVDQNCVQFRTRTFPSNFEIDRRADTLAKLYLLSLYREQGRKAKQIYKSNQIEMNKQREIRKIKQELDVQKMKEGEMIEQMDLIKQVYKILMLIERKMNELAFIQFQQKNGDKATQIKRSLQKLKHSVHQQPSARNKLKLLITYKHKKGW